VHLLADGLQRLGELRVEQLLEGVTVAGAGGAHRLGDPDDVLHGLADLDEERDADVRADVVLADQSFLAGPGDLDGLHRDVHDLGLVQHRQDDLAGEGDVDLADLGDDEGLALFHLAEQLRDDEQGDEYEQQADADDYGDARGGCIHGTRPWELGWERVRGWSGVGAPTGRAGHGRGPEPAGGRVVGRWGGRGCGGGAVAGPLRAWRGTGGARSRPRGRENGSVVRPERGSGGAVVRHAGHWRVGPVTRRVRQAAPVPVKRSD